MNTDWEHLISMLPVIYHMSPIIPCIVIQVLVCPTISYIIPQDYGEGFCVTGESGGAANSKKRSN